MAQIIALILHHETKDLTERVLAQLGGAIDVLVHDDASGEPFITGRKNVAYIRSERNLGYVKSVNLGMEVIRLGMEDLGRAAEDAFVWTLNTDVLGLSPDMAQALAQALVAHPLAAAASPAVVPNAHPQMRHEYAPGVKTFVRHTRFIDWVCPMVRLRAWVEVGGFDPELKGYGCDLDFCRRARDTRWGGFLVLPGLVVRHDMGGTVRRVADARGHDDLGWMNEYLCRKHNVRHWQELY